MQMIGKMISQYRILEELGEGGMGIVYKAEDTKLKRKVAIKFLPHNIDASPEERERFKIEAQATAALNHPNIATIYAIEEIDGESFIVMEYINGRELEEIARAKGFSPLPVDDVINYATQIADGLQAAHEKRIIHRDIKSANIMITEKKQIKIMDFGLAKVHGGVKITKEHTTLGTASYMSPEQARGEDIDHRTDIWSFGVVLYEMLTGQLPFCGEYDSAVLYSILNEEPESIINLRKDVPTEFERIVFKCLTKKRENRYHSAEHLLTDLKQLKKDLDTGRNSALAVQLPRKAKTRKRVAGLVMLGVALVLFLAFVINGLIMFKKRAPEPRIVQTRPITATTTIAEDNPALSPDGSRLAYNSDETGNLDIWVQQLASGHRINLTEDYQGQDGKPVWSPDGQSIAFVSERDGGGIFITSEYGGLARPVVAHRSKEIRGFSWSPDGKSLAYMIVSRYEEKMYIVAIAGGTPTEIPLPEPGYHGPTWSPDGRRLVYSSVKHIWTLRLDGSDPVTVFNHEATSPPIWSNDGKHIFFKWKSSGENPDVWWIPVDRDGRATGAAKILTVGANAYNFSIAGDGKRLAYASGVYRENLWCLPIDTTRILSIADAEQLTFEKQRMRSIAMSPDREWIAFSSNRGGMWDIWIVNKSGKGLRQVTADSTNKNWPSWSPDGKRIAFSRRTPGSKADICVISVNGGLSTLLAPHPAGDYAPTWSPDGKEIAFMSYRNGNADLWVVPANGGEARQLTTHQARDVLPKYSPDGKMISFLSDRTGAFEIYLLADSNEEPRQLTRIGAANWFDYTWSPDGKTIYLSYDPGRDADTPILAAVNVSDGSLRKILESPAVGKYILPAGVTTDSEKLYFVVTTFSSSDIWLAELVYE